MVARVHPPALLQAEVSVYQFPKQTPLLSLCLSFKCRWSPDFQPCPLSQPSCHWLSNPDLQPRPLPFFQPLTCITWNSAHPKLNSLPVLIPPTIFAIHLYFTIKFLMSQSSVSDCCGVLHTSHIHHVNFASCTVHKGNKTPVILDHMFCGEDK